MVTTKGRGQRALPATIYVRRDPDPENDYLFAEETVRDMAEGTTDGELVGVYDLVATKRMSKSAHLID